MLSTLSIGLVGGLVTGLSPCILPILPLVLAVSGNGGRSRPWLVIGGLVTSFTAVTLFATTLLNALHLPGDLVWKVGIGLLVLVGLGMMFPKFQEILEWPFLKLPKAGGLQAKARDKGGFAVGLALGVVFVPCAGPVLAAISVAGATGTIDAHILILCLAFAVGVAIPLMAFALGGNEVGKRVDFFQSHQRGFRFGAGVVVIAMAGAIAVGAPAWLQQKLPSPEFGQEVLAKEASSSKAGQQVPEFQGLTGWFNTDEPVDPRTNGKVTLIDFWAYACINCQRNNVHLTKIYDHYKDSGLEVVGIHAPEYSFEREAANVQRAAREQGIHYPVAQDNDFTTWRAFENQYWPAHYLVDAPRLQRRGEWDGRVALFNQRPAVFAELEDLRAYCLGATAVSKTFTTGVPVAKAAANRMCALWQDLAGLWRGRRRRHLGGQRRGQCWRVSPRTGTHPVGRSLGHGHARGEGF